MNDPMRDGIPANFQDCLDHLICGFADQFIRCVLAFDRRIDLERLRLAAGATLEMVPVFGCRYDSSVKRPVWRRLEDPDSLPLVSLVETAEPARAVRDALVSEQDRERDARVSLALIRGPEADTLVITVDHVAADARGTKEYAYMLATAYSHLAEDPAWRPEPGARPRPTDGELAKRIPWRDRWRASLGQPQPPAGFVVAGRWESHSQRRVETAGLEPEAFRRLRDWGRARGASVNDILLAALARSAFRILDHSAEVPIAFQCTADLRRYLDGGGDGTVCNLSAVLRLPIADMPGEPLEGTAAQAHARMSERKDAYLGLGVALVGTPLYRLGGLPLLRRVFESELRSAREKNEMSPALTNFGVLDAGRLSFAGLAPAEAWMTGPLGFGNSLLLVASSYRDRLTLSIGWCDSDVDAELPTGLLAEAVREIAAVG